MAGPRESVVICFDGDLRATELAVLSEAIGSAHLQGVRVILDLRGLQILDRASMHQLQTWMESGIEIRNRPAYVCAWMEQDRNGNDFANSR